MLNLSVKTDRDKLEQMIADDVEQYCKEIYEADNRAHLGASVLGEQCWRKLYYQFRWFKKPDPDGRVRRIFNVGHEAEPRFIKYLRGIGFEVKPFAQELWYSSELNDYKILEWDADKSGGTGSYLPVDSLFHISEAKKRGLDLKQWRISGAKGHYGGSLDAELKAPERYMLDTALVLSGEFKTNNTGSGFAKVRSEDLSKSKPKHYAQMCQYGVKRGYKYGLYMIENKNDSDITFRIVELDWNYGKSLEMKAEEIIFATEPPPRIAENPSYFDCKYCDDFQGICHRGDKPDKNCRTCRHSKPIENAAWYCTRFEGEIPNEFVKTGCDEWNAI